MSREQDCPYCQHREIEAWDKAHWAGKESETLVFICSNCHAWYDVRREVVEVRYHCSTRTSPPLRTDARVAPPPPREPYQPSPPPPPKKY